MLLLAIHWVYSAFWQLNVLAPEWGSLLALVLGIALYVFRKQLKQVYAFLMRHKTWILLAVGLFQVGLLLSAELLIRRDAAVVFTGAFKILKEQSISNYLTRNPNNMSLFLYERFFYSMFGTNALWVLQAINLLCADITAVFLYKAGKKHFGPAVGDGVFTFYVLLLGFSPFFMAMYTDILILPLVSLQLLLGLDLLKEEERRVRLRKSVLLGFLTAVAMLFRPTTVILLVGLWVVIFFKSSWRQWLPSLAVLGLAFAVPFGIGSYAVKHQTQVPLVKGEGLAKGPLLFINLGLTYTGTDQWDMKQGLLEYIPESERKNYNNGMFATENVKKEIVRRWKAYTPMSFLDHMEYKQRWSVMDGTLDWMYYKDVDEEKTPYVSPLYERVKGNAVATWIRNHFISFDHEDYKGHAIFKQLVWIGMAIGLVLVFLRFRIEDWDLNFMTLAIFGGLLFLAIFEGGKTRYLIQFLPQILMAATLGWTRYRPFSKDRSL